MPKVVPNPHFCLVALTATRQQENCGAKTNAGSEQCNSFVNKNFSGKVKLVTFACNSLTPNSSSIAPYFNLEFTLRHFIVRAASQ